MKGFALGLIMLLKQRLLSSEKLPVVLQLLDVCADTSVLKNTHIMRTCFNLSLHWLLLLFLQTPVQKAWQGIPRKFQVFYSLNEGSNSSVQNITDMLLNETLLGSKFKSVQVNTSSNTTVLPRLKSSRVYRAYMKMCNNRTCSAMGEVYMIQALVPGQCYGVTACNLKGVHIFYRDPHNEGLRSVTRRGTQLMCLHSPTVVVSVFCH